MLKNILYVFGIAALIILILAYLDSIVGLEVFLVPLEAFGISVNPNNILLTTIILFIAAAILFLVINYLNMTHIRYEFYDDRLKLYEPTLWVILIPREISFKNIVKISYNYAGFTNKLFKSGEIVIDVTGMKEGFVKMEVIDQAEELVEQLLKIVNEYNSLQQMQFEENQRIGNIMKKF
jgi:hypothetical protein